MSSSRRSSVGSVDSITNPSTPLIGPPEQDEPSPTLVLVHDEEAQNESFDFLSDDDLEDDFSTQLDRLRASPIPLLSPTLVFLYLLMPYLKLGAMFLPSADLSLSRSVPALLVFALFSAAARHMWYMLAKYVGRADLEEIVLDAFARSRSHEQRRLVLRGLVRVGSGVLRILLAFMYLRDSVHALLPLFPARLALPSRAILSLALAALVLPLCLASNFAAKRMVYATSLSLVAYLVWFGCVSYAHARGTLEVNASWLRAGTLWQGITTIAFVFASSWTIPLYASLKASAQPIRLRKSRRRSFKALFALAAFVAISLTLPLCFYSASPNHPESSNVPPNAVIAVTEALTLLLAIPSLIITTPSLPISASLRRSTRFPISKVIVYLGVVVLSLLSTSVCAILSDILLVLALSSTYVLPALLHITIHEFHSPLSIVLPSHSSPSSPVSPSDAADELLQRKERTLQRRRLGRRLAWDVCAWLMLLPVGGGGAVWALGRIVGKW